MFGVKRSGSCSTGTRLLVFASAAVWVERGLMLGRLCLKSNHVELERISKLISGITSLGMFGLPQRGKEAEGAANGYPLCHLCTIAPLRQSRRFLLLSKHLASSVSSRAFSAIRFGRRSHSTLLSVWGKAERLLFHWNKALLGFASAAVWVERGGLILGRLCSQV